MKRFMGYVVLVALAAAPLAHAEQTPEEVAENIRRAQRHQEFERTLGPGESLTLRPEDVKKVEEAVSKNLPGPDFHIVTSGCWVIVTDLSDADTKRCVNGLINTLAAGIRKQLFTKQEPWLPQALYLFKSAESFNAGVEKVFGEKPNTPFAYAIPGKEYASLAVNLATGGGTLLHMLVRPLVRFDFPTCPLWLEDGLACLYEASVVKNGRVVGVSNWRLPYLKTALEKGTVFPIASLLVAKDDDFIRAVGGGNCTSGRYFMQWLQDQGKLDAFYFRIRDGKDANALASLRTVFDNKYSVDEIEKQFHTWVRGLDDTPFKQAAKPAAQAAQPVKPPAPSKDDF